MPLDNVSGDAAQGYFAEAMTEELTNQMAALPLRIISRTSASRYRGTSKDLREIASELQVDALIEGSVFRSGEQVRITVQLVRGDTDQHVWSKSYQRASNDLIGLQGEVAQAIAQEIQLALSPAEQRRLQSPITRNPQAYEAYLRATYHLREVFGSEQIADDAVANAEKAIALDPEFAEAYVALASACVGKIFAWGGGAAYDEKAFVALGRAMALKPDLADAYWVRGSLYFTKLHNFDIARAVADYRRAVQLNPNSAEAHHLLGSEYTHSGLHEKAIAEYRASLLLDPHQGGSKFRIGRAMWQSGRFAEALEHYERNNVVNFEKAFTLANLGRRKEASDTLDRLLERVATPRARRGGGPNTGDLAAVRAFLHAIESSPREAEQEIQRAVRLGRDLDHFHHAAFIIAAAYAEMGKKQEAVTWLRRVSETGMPNFPLFRDNPSIRKLQGYPEYEEFMAQFKLRWEQLAASLQ